MGDKNVHIEIPVERFELFVSIEASPIESN